MLALPAPVAAQLLDGKGGERDRAPAVPGLRFLHLDPGPSLLQALDDANGACVEVDIAPAQRRHDDPIAAILDEGRGQLLFRGKVVDVARRTTEGFLRGQAGPRRA